MQADFTRFAPSVSTRNAFDGMDDDASATTDGAATNGTSGQVLVNVPPQMFFAPLNPSMPVSFAPSTAQRPAAGSQSVALDFSEFEAEIGNMEAAKRQEFQDALQAQADKIRAETNGTAALPSQIGDSKLFHSMVLKQYG